MGERVGREKERREVTRCTRSATPSSTSNLDRRIVGEHSCSCSMSVIMLYISIVRGIFNLLE